MKLKRFVTQEVYKETINALYCEGPIISCACLFTNRSLPQLQLRPVGVEDVPRPVPRRGDRYNAAQQRDPILPRGHSLSVTLAPSAHLEHTHSRHIAVEPAPEGLRVDGARRVVGIHREGTHACDYTSAHHPGTTLHPRVHRVVVVGVGAETLALHAVSVGHGAAVSEGGTRCGGGMVVEGEGQARVQEGLVYRRREVHAARLLIALHHVPRLHSHQRVPTFLRLSRAASQYFQHAAELVQRNASQTVGDAPLLVVQHAL